MPGRLPDRVEAFENGDVAGVVRSPASRCRRLRLCLQRHRRALSRSSNDRGDHRDESPQRGCWSCVTDALSVPGGGHRLGLQRTPREASVTGPLTRAFGHPSERSADARGPRVGRGRPGRRELRPHGRGSRARDAASGSPRRGGRRSPRACRPSRRTGRTCAATPAHQISSQRPKTRGDHVGPPDAQIARRPHPGPPTMRTGPTRWTGRGRRSDGLGRSRRARRRSTAVPPATSTTRSGVHRRGWVDSRGQQHLARRQLATRAAEPARRRARRTRRRAAGPGVRRCSRRRNSCVARRRARATHRCSPCDAWVRAGPGPTQMSRSSRWGPTEVTWRRTSSARRAARASDRSPSHDRR